MARRLAARCTTGKALGADEGTVKTIPVRVEDGRIAIGLDEMLMAAE